MTATTKIEWADSTFNPWIGCTKISPACDHCYAEAQMDTRMGRVEWGSGKARSRTSAAYWKQPLKWDAERFVECGDCGYRGRPALAAVGAVRDGDEVCCAACFSRRVGPARRRVFCASLADVFDNEADPAWRADLFELIAATPNLDWLLLTKRIGNVTTMAADACETIKLRGFVGNEYMRGKGDMRAVAWPLPNIWLGATICNQAEADRDIPKLLATPAAKRFLSIEPMLGPIDLERPMPGPDIDQGGGAKICQPWYIQSGLDWIICGGESGPHARPMHHEWARSLRDQCAAAGVPFLFKQWGEFCHPTQMPDDCDGSGSFLDDFFRVGKHAAGRLLDGVEHSGVPA